MTQLTKNSIRQDSNLTNDSINSEFITTKEDLLHTETFANNKKESNKNIYLSLSFLILFLGLLFFVRRYLKRGKAETHSLPPIVKTPTNPQPNPEPQPEPDKLEVKKVNLKKISYQPSGLHSNDLGIYPTVLYPKINSVIKFPRTGRYGNKGFTEDKFLTNLNKYFESEFTVFTNHHLTQKGSGRPYEPDFILANEKENKNIFINIEIDEPYDGLNRFPTHIIDQDKNRNNYFINRGYIYK